MVSVPQEGIAAEAGYVPSGEYPPQLVSPYGRLNETTDARAGEVLDSKAPFPVSFSNLAPLISITERAESEAKEIRAEAKLTAEEAKLLRSPGGRAVMEKLADVRKQSAEVKELQAVAEKAQMNEKQDRVHASQEKDSSRRAELLKRAEEHKQLAEQKRAEVKQKQEASVKKQEEYRADLKRREEERKQESARAFVKVNVVKEGKDKIAENLALRHELKTESLQPALNLLSRNSRIADLPPCGQGVVLCIPQQRVSAALPPPPVPKIAYLAQVQRKVALLIGINAYKDKTIPSLESALPDAQAVGRTLSDHLGYEVRVLPDASRSDIITQLNQVALDVGPNDSVIVYYAGHGYLDEKTHKGYWIPGDAEAKSPVNWINNSDVAKLLGNIPAKQVMLISDSCYSGALTREQLMGTSQKIDADKILARRTVTIMSSGGEEPVSDEGKDGHSIFAWNLMNALKSVKQVEGAGRVFETVKKEVQKEFPQEPNYGGAATAGHEPGGEYLLETRSYK